MKLIVGLGNPGKAYTDTPHNMGYRAVDSLAARLGIRLRSRWGSRGLLGAGQRAGEEILLLKPTTYMNLSGEAVAPVARKKRLYPEDIFVLVDDCDLPMGALRWRPKGGDGGHKGLRSVIQELGSEDIPRLRIGIQPESRPEDLESYVLVPFGERDQTWADRIAELAAESVDTAIRQGVETAANHFNGMKIPCPEEIAPKERFGA